ncbi:hypothetical protein KLY11_000667 [Salmonella enterica]|nr:hypothetical protein [Salmonella enterica]
MQRTGFPNVSIKLYQDYEAFLNHRFIELGATFVTMTLRDSLKGVNEGLLQFYDNKAMHTKLTGREIIQVSLSTANTEEVFTTVAPATTKPLSCRLCHVILVAPATHSRRSDFI